MKALTTILIFSVLMSSFGCAKRNRDGGSVRDGQQKIEDSSLFSSSELDPVRGKLVFPGSDSYASAASLSRYASLSEKTAIAALLQIYVDSAQAYSKAAAEYNTSEFSGSIDNANKTRALLSLLYKDELSINRYNELKKKIDYQQSAYADRAQSQRQQNNSSGAEIAGQIFSAALLTAGAAIQYENNRQETRRQELRYYEATRPRSYRCERSGGVIECRPF